MSGAVGTFAHVDPRVETFVAAKLGLAVEPVSTQVIPRDRHAAFFCTLAVVATGVERLATEVRHLQRSEVREAEEFFHPGQKGSSAMPHKRNPVLSENLTGLARVVRAAPSPALENVALWHERDISHSSVERAIGPDATVTLDFALVRLAGMMDKLTIYPERMADQPRQPRRRGPLGRGVARPGPGRRPARGRLSHRPASAWRLDRPRRRAASAAPNPSGRVAGCSTRDGRITWNLAVPVRSAGRVAARQRGPATRRWGPLARTPARRLARPAHAFERVCRGGSP